MNKRISTLLTAFLLMVGALFSNANAAVSYDAAAGDLKEGLKVYLGNDAGTAFLASSQIGTSGNYTFKTGSDAEAFTVTGLKKENGKNLFKLVNAAGKTIYGKIGGTYVETADATDVTAGSCWFSADDATSTITLGGQPLTFDMSTASNVAKMLIATEEFDADQLNANLSGKGFSFSFPNALSQPDVNPFAGQMVAVEASAVNTALSAGPSTGLYFALANEAGLKLLTSAGITADNVKAATFVALDPNNYFGIRALTVAGEGYGFTTVKGDKLATDNKKADGKIAYVNAVYAVSEDDAQNAPGEYTIKLEDAKVAITGNENNAASDLFVGAFSLTTGGLKTYITTVTDMAASQLSLAQTSSNTWATAKDVLKANDATIVNIIFVGEQPANATAAGTSLYGKYLVPVYGSANYTASVLAPEHVDLNAPVAQWVVTGVTGHSFTFTNRETNVTFTADLYKTNKAGEFMLGGVPTMNNSISSVGGDITAGTPDLTKLANWKSQVIKISAVQGNEGFLALTDDELGKQAEIVFHGTGNITVEDLFISYPSTGSVYAPLNDGSESIKWEIETAESVKNVIKYVYMDGDAVAKKDTAIVINSYILSDKANTAYAPATPYLGAAFAKTLVAKATAQRYIFKKNVNGTYAMMAVSISGADDAAKYISAIKSNATKVNVDIATAAFIPATATLDQDATYSNVTVDFNRLAVSLESVARHATLDSEDGSVAMKLNKNGLFEGVISDNALTFWLDTADVEKEIPSFYISNGIKDSEERNFLYYAKDSLLHWDANKATYVYDVKYALEGSYTTTDGSDGDAKAIFRAATLAGIDTLATTVAGKAVKVAEKAEEGVCLAGVNNFKYNIMLAGDNSYVIMPVGATNTYLYNLNGKLGFTTDFEKALVVTLGAGSATSNETEPSVSAITVLAKDGAVNIIGAAGKKVVVSNILGQVVANTVITSDDAVIAAPAGVVVVAVEGEAAVKAIVK